MSRPGEAEKGGLGKKEKEKKKMKSDTVIHSCNPSSREAGAGQSQV